MKLSGDGAVECVECCGKVPFYRQLKHPEKSSPTNLSSRREMRLIEAEPALRAEN